MLLRSDIDRMVSELQVHHKRVERIIQFLESLQKQERKERHPKCPPALKRLLREIGRSDA